MEQVNLENFVADYINAWSTKDAGLRKSLIAKVYASTANFYADEPGDEAVEHHGLAAIYKNISQVNERLVVGNGLTTASTGYAENHKTLRVTWEMKASDGNVVMNGMNLLILDSSGKIQKDYIFIN